MNSEELLKTLESLTNKLKVANQIAAELEDFEAEELMEMSLNGLIKIAEGNNIDLTDVSSFFCRWCFGIRGMIDPSSSS